MEDMRMTFEQWKSKVNEAVERLVGLSCDDLSDYCYADAWEDGVSPIAAARRAIRNSE